MTRIVPIRKEDVRQSRIERLEGLPVFQELFVEMLVEGGIYYSITIQDSQAGYAVLTPDRILVEFYLKDPYIPYCPEIFEEILIGLNIRKVYCQSFDPLLLNCCLLRYPEYQLIGYSFRDMVEVPSYTDRNLQVRRATGTDYPFLLEQEDGLYETPGELQFFLERQSVLMFLNTAQQLVGCGYLIRVHDRFDYFDIGMWVHPGFRNRGVATSIISWLKEWCVKHRFIPVCGCDIHNVYSRKTLEKNGFVSKYKLIGFHISDPIKG